MSFKPLEKHTKIVATIGPASSSVPQLKKLLNAGMNIVRLNFSHGDFAEHQEKIDNAKQASKETGKPVAFMQDLAGPEIRTGWFGATPDEMATIKKGSTVTIVTKKQVSTADTIYVDYKKLCDEIEVGGKILIDDGKVTLIISKIDKKKGEVVCKATAGGTIRGKRGVNLPGAKLSLKSLTKKDKDDLAFGIKNKVEFVAFSFVRTAKDVKELRTILDKSGLQNTGIIPKIETEEAVENIGEIIEESDAVMIARGDLAPEMTLEDVPLAQKHIIEACRFSGTPVIVATQMIETMMDKPAPTRAEVSDIANAVFDGTDAIMLSGESALGDYPVEAVNMMNTIALKVENDPMHQEMLLKDTYYPEGIGNMMSASAVFTAESIGATYIICLSEYGYTARMISRLRPEQPIIAFTPNKITAGKLLMSYGISPVEIKKHKSFDDTMKEVRSFLTKNKLVRKGDSVVIASGTPFKKTTETNVVVVEQF